MDLSITRQFGRTGVSVTPLAVGTSSWGPQRSNETPASRDARVAAMADAFFAGKLESNLLDTSNMYGDSESEPQIGQGIARAGGIPTGLVVQTKLDRDPVDHSYDGERMWKSVEESRHRLGVGNIQVLFLHDPEQIGFEASMAPGGPVDALVKMKSDGLATAIGISGGPVDMMQRFVETDLFDALVTHNRFTLLDRSANALLDAATERNMGITNAAPYGAGILTGDPRFAGSYGYKPIRPETQVALDAMTALCRDAGVSLGAAALQFSLRDPRVHSTIVGTSSVDRFTESVAYATETIPEDLWAALDEHLPAARFALDLP